MSSDNVLGPEWGSLAGMTKDDALDVMARYANSLENKRANKETNKANSELSDEEESTTLDTASILKHHSLQPATTEFVGRREAARATARRTIAAQGQNWDRFADMVEQALATATADQQTNPKTWEEAWWYLWGLEQRNAIVNPPADEEEPEEEVTVYPPRSTNDMFDEPEEEVEEEPAPRTAVTVRTNVDRSGLPPRATTKSKRITDPGSKHVKRQFEQYLGKPISDTEWIGMQDVNTAEEYETLQKAIARRAK